ncbi:MAG: alpha/beta hydrolase family protein [Streptosporangiaceae bacterium]
MSGITEQEAGSAAGKGGQYRPAAAGSGSAGTGGARDGGRPSGGRVSRRALLRAGALGGGAAATLAAGGVAAARARAAAGARVPASQVAAKPPAFELFAQPDLNFETLFTLGSAGYGVSEVGEVVTAVNDINARGASYQAYFDCFAGLARRVASLADSELAAGRSASARSAYLRAASYYDACLFFVLGTSHRAQEAAVYARMQRNWNRAAQLFDPPFVPVRIPYGRSWLPGYLLRPDHSAVARPTVILNNGSDAQNVDLYAFGGAAALERGYNALIFEGPGQGSVLFEREVFFRADWEHVVSPIVDWLSGLPYVDPGRIAITGWSLCGESVIRAAAFEHRLAAVVADPGVLDAWLAYPTGIRQLFDHGYSKAELNHIWNTDVVPGLTPVDRFTLAKRSELFGKPYLAAGRAGRVFTDLYDLGQTIMRVNCEATAGLVTSPALVTSYELDEFVGGQAEAVFRLLGDIPRELHTFTVAQGAEYHDAPMAPQTRNQVVFDWLDETLS